MPTGDKALACRSKVPVVTATFNSTVAVPNVVGQTQAAAVRAITGAGLVAGTVTQQASSTVASGEVLSESPAGGTNVAGGSTVNLVVSSGSSTGGGGHGGGGGIDSLTLGALLSVLMATLRRVTHRTARSCIRDRAALNRTKPETGLRRDVTVQHLRFLYRVRSCGPLDGLSLFISVGYIYSP